MLKSLVFLRFFFALTGEEQIGSSYGQNQAAAAEATRRGLLRHNRYRYIIIDFIFIFSKLSVIVVISMANKHFDVVFIKLSRALFVMF